MSFQVYGSGLGSGGSLLLLGFVAAGLILGRGICRHNDVSDIWSGEALGLTLCDGLGFTLNLTTPKPSFLVFLSLGSLYSALTGASR